MTTDSTAFLIQTSRILQSEIDLFLIRSYHAVSYLIRFYYTALLSDQILLSILVLVVIIQTFHTVEDSSSTVFLWPRSWNPQTRISFFFDFDLETLERKSQSISFFSDFGSKIFKRSRHRRSISSSSDLDSETLRRKSLRFSLMIHIRFSLIIHKSSGLARFIHKISAFDSAWSFTNLRFLLIHKASIQTDHSQIFGFGTINS